MTLPLHKLSQHDRVLLHALAVDGYTEPEIAKELGRPDTTIKYYFVALAKKLALSGHMQLAQYYADMGGDIRKLGGREHPWNKLSTKSKKIALLASLGHSNDRIGIKMESNANAIGSALTRIYKGLAIRSRCQLPGVLAQLTDRESHDLLLR